jgi:hypothetical protein
MENRADKHLARQDDVLIRAITRVWKARERGLLLERVKMVRLVKDVWATWIRRMQFQARLEGQSLLHVPERQLNSKWLNQTSHWHSHYVQTCTSPPLPSRPGEKSSFPIAMRMHLLSSTTLLSFSLSSC